MRVLIIDDDVIDRTAITRNLKRADLEISAIDQTGLPAEGLKLARASRYDIILLDYRLPPSNGIEVLRELRGLPDFCTAVVMISHSDDEQLALRCVEAGAQDFLMKGEVTVSRLRRSILLAAERYELERKVAESHRQMRHLAEIDSLTGLRNRYFFDEAMKDAFPYARRSGNLIALVLLDLDNFKNINDTLGHLAGDLFLKQVARRLEGPVRDGDKLCRLGGDEFAVLVQHLERADHVRLLVDRILESLRAPVVVSDREIRVSASIGVATFPECGDTPVELLKSADVAMYRAKELGKNQVQYYESEFHDYMQHRMALESALETALEKDELVLHYQPQLDATTGLLVGVEALIRWQHPEHGLLYPDAFIPLAEESGLIKDIGRWVLSSACKQFQSWLNQGGDRGVVTFSIAANLSARQLLDNGLINYLETCLRDCSVPPSALELELTESSLEDSVIAMEQLTALSATGVRLALDDFGTGYSSLSHLRDYPFDVLKIDKGFVMNIESEQDATLLSAICAFAQSMGYETVAEGVETEFQRDICTSLGIQRLQGYLFSRPLPAEEFQTLWLERGEHSNGGLGTGKAFSGQNS